MPDPQTSPLERWLKIVGVALTFIGMMFREPSPLNTPAVRKWGVTGRRSGHGK